MKKLTLYIGIIGITITICFFIFNRSKVEIPTTLDPRDAQVDSLIQSQAQIIQNLTDSVAYFKDTLEVVQTEAKPQVEIRFRTNTVTDTVWRDSIKIDIAEAVAANECFIRLDSNRIAVYHLDSALSTADRARGIIRNQLIDYKQLDKLWTDKEALRWHQCGKKRRKLKKIRKIKQSFNN